MSDNELGKIKVLREQVIKLTLENEQLLQQLMIARQQLEHVLATIRNVYDDVRAEHTRELMERADARMFDEIPDQR